MTVRDFYHFILPSNSSLSLRICWLPLVMSRLTFVRLSCPSSMNVVFRFGGCSLAALRSPLRAYDGQYCRRNMCMAIVVIRLDKNALSTCKSYSSLRMQGRSREHDGTEEVTPDLHV